MQCRGHPIGDPAVGHHETDQHRDHRPHAGIEPAIQAEFGGRTRIRELDHGQRHRGDENRSNPVVPGNGGLHYHLTGQGHRHQCHRTVDPRRDGGEQRDAHQIAQHTLDRPMPRLRGVGDDQHGRGHDRPVRAIHAHRERDPARRGRSDGDAGGQRQFGRTRPEGPRDTTQRCPAGCHRTSQRDTTDLGLLRRGAIDARHPTTTSQRPAIPFEGFGVCRGIHRIRGGELPRRCGVPVPGGDGRLRVGGVEPVVGPGGACGGSYGFGPSQQTCQGGELWCGASGRRHPGKRIPPHLHRYSGVVASTRDTGIAGRDADQSRGRFEPACHCQPLRSMRAHQCGGHTHRPRQQPTQHDQSDMAGHLFDPLRHEGGTGHHEGEDDVAGRSHPGGVADQFVEAGQYRDHSDADGRGFDQGRSGQGDGGTGDHAEDDPGERAGPGDVRHTVPVHRAQPPGAGIEGELHLPGGQ